MCYCKPAPMPTEAGTYRVRMHSSGEGIAVIDPQAAYPIVEANGFYPDSNRPWAFRNLPWQGLGADFVFEVKERLT